MNTRGERLGYRFVTVVAFLAVAVGGASAWAAFAPDDSVRISPAAAVMTGPDVVPQGGTVSWERAWFCNEGVPTRTERTALRSADDSRSEAGYELPAVTFHPDGASCMRPLPTRIILPNYLPPGEYRLRLVTSWDAPGLKGVRSFTTYSPPFTITAP